MSTIIQYAIKTPIGFIARKPLNRSFARPLSDARLWNKYEDAVISKDRLIAECARWLDMPQTFYRDAQGNKLRLPVTRKITNEEVREWRRHGVALTRAELKKVKVVKVRVTRTVMGDQHAAS